MIPIFGMVPTRDFDAHQTDLAKITDPVARTVLSRVAPGLC